MISFDSKRVREGSFNTDLFDRLSAMHFCRARDREACESVCPGRTVE